MCVCVCLCALQKASILLQRWKPLPHSSLSAQNSERKIVPKGRHFDIWIHRVYGLFPSHVKIYTLLHFGDRIGSRLQIFFFFQNKCSLITALYCHYKGIKVELANTTHFNNSVKDMVMQISLNIRYATHKHARTHRPYMLLPCHH